MGEIVHVEYLGNALKGGQVGVTALENKARLSFGSEAIWRLNVALLP